MNRLIRYFCPDALGLRGIAVVAITPPAIVLAALLALAACGQNATQTQATTIYAVEGAYDAAAVVERNYLTGTFGKPDAVMVARMKAADNVAYNLIVKLRADAQAGVAVAQTTIDAATVAVQNLAAINAAAGAH